MFEELDLARWRTTGEEWLGTKEKRWVLDPEEGLWLWKKSGQNLDAAGAPFLKGDDWSECVATAVARALGLPCAEVHLARWGDDLGVVSRCFYRRQMSDDVPEDLPDEQFRLGNELLASIGVEGRNDRDRAGYTPEAVARSLEHVAAPEGSPISAFGVFAGYLILDAIVGNTDRHQQNWGAVEAVDGELRLAPTFDHASCLGFMLSDDARSGMLDERGSPKLTRFASRARSKFEGHPSPTAVAVSALALLSDDERRQWCEILGSFSVSDRLTDDVPAGRMSDVSRRFAQSLLAVNHASLSDHLRTMCT